MRILLVMAAALRRLPAFSTAPKTSPDTRDAALLHDAAAGCHDTFDRFVVQAELNAPGYDVRYVRRIVADPSGRPVSLLGAKRMRVAFKLAGGHDNRGTNLLAGTLTPPMPEPAAGQEGRRLRGRRVVRPGPAPDDGLPRLPADEPHARRDRRRALSTAGTVRR